MVVVLVVQVVVAGRVDDLGRISSPAVAGLTYGDVSNASFHSIVDWIEILSIFYNMLVVLQCCL